MKKIEVLGTGCPKCKKLYEEVKRAVEALGVEAEVLKVEDIQKIIAYGVMATPGLVVDGAVKMNGRVPSAEEIKKLIS